RRGRGDARDRRGHREGSRCSGQERQRRGGPEAPRRDGALRAGRQPDVERAHANTASVGAGARGVARRSCRAPLLRCCGMSAAPSETTMIFAIMAFVMTAGGAILGIRFMFAGASLLEEWNIGVTDGSLVVLRRLGALYLGLALMFFLGRHAAP